MFLDCFSTVQDLECQRNNVGNASDEIFFNKECRSMDEICSISGLVGVNVSYCFNETSQTAVSINDVISRVLSAEEFF